MESEKQRNPQEVIIKELVARISSHFVYDLSTLEFLKTHTKMYNSEKIQLYWITCATTTDKLSSYLFLLHGSENGYWEVEGFFQAYLVIGHNRSN